MSDQARQGMLSPFLQARRFAAARPHVRGRVLDFACGGGAFAQYCDPAGYFGCDLDQDVIERAKRDHPEYAFGPTPPPGQRFDCVVALAFLEHVEDPSAYLRTFAGALDPGGCIVTTTPHPMYRIVHDTGAKVGIFSQEASDEHEAMLDRAALQAAASAAGLRLSVYRRFLGGANQLAVFSAHD